LKKHKQCPDKGSVGGFNYGVGYGKILSSLEINQIPFQEVHTDEMEKEFGNCIKKRKI